MLDEPTILTLAEEVIEEAMDELRERGEFNNILGLVKQEGGQIECFPIPHPPEWWNDWRSKRLLFQIQRDLVQTTLADGTLTLTDSFFIMVGGKAAERYNALSEEKKRELSNVNALVAAGYGEKAECIFAVVQTPLLKVAIRQPYYREKNHIRFGERSVLKPTDTGVYGGPIFEAFPDPHSA